MRANLEKAIQYAKLQDQFGEILVATEDFAVMKDRKKTITRRKTFPCYVLVEMDLNNETRALVTNIPGVTHFVGDEKNPTPLTETRDQPDPRAAAWPRRARSRPRSRSRSARASR